MWYVSFDDFSQAPSIYSSGKKTDSAPICLPRAWFEKDEMVLCPFAHTHTLDSFGLKAVTIGVRAHSSLFRPRQYIAPPRRTTFPARAKGNETKINKLKLTRIKKKLRKQRRKHSDSVSPVALSRFLLATFGKDAQEGEKAKNNGNRFAFLLLPFRFASFPISSAWSGARQGPALAAWPGRKGI